MCPTQPTIPAKTALNPVKGTALRIYTIDQLSHDDTAVIHSRFVDMNLKSGLEGIFWLPIPDNLLNQKQNEHKTQCGPYCMALEIDDEAVHLELLVRGLGRLRCECLGPASPVLREHMIGYLDSILHDLLIQF